MISLQMELKNFIVYKSSAGSGKTYALVKEYLKLVLTDPSKVRRILAITFTNAASAEMKERIIKSLAEIVAYRKSLTDPESKEYVNTKKLIGQIVSETSLDETSLLDNSQKVLQNILHNYNDFSISTIDSFTHRILRTFAFDLRIPLNFEIEFDTQQTIEQAADILISRTGAGNSSILTDLMVNFIESRADEERSFAIEREIIQMATKMLNEDSISYIGKLKEKDISDFMKACRKINEKLEKFKNRIVELATKGLNIIDDSVIQIRSLARGEGGIYSWFKNLSQGQIIEKLPPKNYVNDFINKDKWHSSKAEKQDIGSINKIAPDLKSIAGEIIALSQKELKEYILLDNIRNNIFSLALINEMEKIMDDIRDEENILFIADFNRKISDVIAHEPVPFIYERVGEKYENYMIDEFQDTSVLQWQNMLPLIENSLARGYMSLLVGDAKQSIYRWRGGDAQQFIRLPRLTEKIFSVNKNEAEQTLKANYRQIPENPEKGTVNYRSLKNIVEFNNDFFETLKPRLPGLIKEVYTGHRQISNKQGRDGLVEISFIPEVKGNKEKYEKETVEKVQNIINKLVDEKYNYNDIAVLCRRKKEAAAVAKHLANEGIYVVSDESLLLSGSAKVNFLIALMKVINDPENNPALTECVNFMLSNNIVKQPHNLHLCLEELFYDDDKSENGKANIFKRFVELLNKNGLKIPPSFFSANTVYEIFEESVRLFFPSQKNICPYLTFFFDCVYEYQQTRQNSIPGFLRYWDENRDSFSLVIPDTMNAVKVMTIHKSKGLQFPVVIFPFAKEISRSNIEDGFWISFDDKTIPELNVAYIRARKNLLDTDYSELYKEEEENRMLDLINLTYVAFTRPMEKLFVVSSVPQNGKFPQNSLNSLIHQYLTDKSLWNDEKLVYTIPEQRSIKSDVDQSVSKKEANVKEAANEWLGAYINQPWKNKIKASVAGELYEPGRMKSITRGKAVHRAMENIFTPKDIPAAVKLLASEGYIVKEEIEVFEKNISDLLNNSLIKPFFSEKHTIKTEAGILDANGNYYKPDRIVFSPGQTAVLDYKTGIQQEKYKYQIRKYGKLLDEMNYKNVRLFIVYIDQDIIEEIV